MASAEVTRGALDVNMTPYHTIPASSATRHRFLTSSTILLLLLAAFVSSFLFVQVAHADYQDGFDSYPSGIGVRPDPWHTANPWTFVGTGTNCWVGNVMSKIILHADGPNSGTVGPYTPPNDYNITYTNGGSCGSTSGTLELSVRPQTVGADLNFTFEAESSVLIRPTLAGTDCAANTVCIFPTVCNTQFTTLPQAFTPKNATWKKESFSITAPSISNCLDSIQINPNGFAAKFTILIDAVIIKGSDAMYSDANTWLQWLPTSTNPAGQNRLFNITNYPRSSILINYSGGRSPYIFYNYTGSNTVGVPAPDVKLPLECNTLNGNPYQCPSMITVYVSTETKTSLGNLETTTLYQRSTIVSYKGCPNPCFTAPSQYLYLDDPSTNTIIDYTFQVNDFTGDFSGSSGGQLGAKITVSSGGTNITSGYLDSNSQFVTGLPPGNYNVMLSQGNHAYATTVSLSTTSASATITIRSVQVTYPQSQQTGVSCIGWFFPGPYSNITGWYQDRSGTTSSVQIFLYVFNATYPIGRQILTSGTPVASSNYTFTFTNSTSPTHSILLSQAQNYRVICQSTASEYGGQQYSYPSLFGQPVVGGPLSGHQVQVFPDVFHLGVIFPNTQGGVQNPTAQIGATSILVTIASIFSEIGAGIALPIFGLFAFFLIGTGWLNIPMIFPTLLVFIGGIGFLLWTERRNR